MVRGRHYLKKTMVQPCTVEDHRIHHVAVEHCSASTGERQFFRHQSELMSTRYLGLLDGQILLQSSTDGTSLDGNGSVIHKQN
ncbi:hypothetical protein TNCV_4299741 [Trichonephila clavipes]|nr:hypothetical protein TNCV_4299741 [Trichonephila clavipes]